MSNKISVGENIDGENSTSDEEQMDHETEKSSEKAKEKKVYIPGISRLLREGEEWQFDPSAYKIYHPFQTKWPCMSFDTVVDKLGENRTEYPLTFYMAAGTQAEKAWDNELLIMKLSNLSGEREIDDESEDDEDENNPNTPMFHIATIEHNGGVNRIRTTNLGHSTVCAVWNDKGKVQIWNGTEALNELEKMEGKKSIKKLREKVLFSFVGHQTEGFGLAWSPLVNGSLASGDNYGKIHLWKMGEGGQWLVDQRPLVGHTKSVEDIAWSPSEQALLTTCSADGSIKLWDTRSAPRDSCVCTVANAHDADVNVLSWNKNEPLIVSGGDDAMLKIWSLKTIQYGSPVAKFKHHKRPITSVEWSPYDSTTFIASGEDDQTTIWDIALEAETSTESNEGNLEVPPQLLFIHMGQTEIKEVHWHPQVVGLAMTTALSGFNAFRTVNV